MDFCQLWPVTAVSKINRVFFMHTNALHFKSLFDFLGFLSLEGCIPRSAEAFHDFLLCFSVRVDDL